MRRLNVCIYSRSFYYRYNRISVSYIEHRRSLCCGFNHHPAYLNSFVRRKSDIGWYPPILNREGAVASSYIVDERKNLAKIYGQI